jgi:hypothetical protein
MCARQLLGCRRVVPETSCPWWPLFPGNPSLGARSLRREQAVKSARLLRPSSAPTTRAIAAALGG